MVYNGKPPNCRCRRPMRIVEYGVCSVTCGVGTAKRSWEANRFSFERGLLADLLHCENCYDHRVCDNGLCRMICVFYFSIL